MALTFAHPAIVLPFAKLPRQWVSVTGLVIGSMTPDFEKFIKMEFANAYGHSLAGIFWFNLPLSLLLSFVFHGFVRNPLINHLPTTIYLRLQPYQSYKWLPDFKKRYPVIILSVFIGVCSHLILDAFTHKNGLFVQHLPILQLYAFTLLKAKIYIYNIAQLVTSVVGLMGIYITILKLPIPPNVATARQKSIYFWFIIGLITGVITVIRFRDGINLNSYWDIAYSLIAAGFIGIFLASVLVNISARKN